jgi:hypothetical protein
VRPDPPLPEVAPLPEAFPEAPLPCSGGLPSVLP